MPEILVTVRDKFAENTLRHMYVCSNSDYQIRFDFDDEWVPHQVKTARFKCGTAYQDVVFTGDICPMPIIENAAVIYVGVYAGDLHTTTAAIIRSFPSILSGNGAPADPPPDVYAQIMAKIDSGVLQGPEGKSAYQVALENGFVGTETQWLASLQGPPGDTTAADAAAAAAQTAAEASAGSAAQAAESVSVLADDLTALKAENTTLKAETARTARSLAYLWKKSKGIIYDTETVTGTGSSVTVPSGAMDYAALRKLGGMSQRGEENNVLIDAPVDEVTVTGKNLLDTTEMKDTVTHAGITYTKNSDGSYRRIGTAEDDSGNLWLWGSWKITPTFNPPNYLMILEKNHKYIISGVSIFSVDGDEEPIAFHGNSGGVVVTPLTDFYVTGVRNPTHVSGTTYNDIVYPAVYEADVPPIDWQPYHKDTYPIPQAIRDLCPDYGQGTAESYNYIDFTAKTYHHVGRMSQDGTWTALATPETIDLSAVWPDDDFGVLRVEAGGTIGLHYPALDDGYELAVPSETEIMVDVAKVVGTDG